MLGVALQASEAGCEVLAFVRDRDRDPGREQDLLEGVRQAKERLARCPRLVGGVAIESIESWVLSAKGVARAEKVRRPKEQLNATVAEMVEAIESADLERLPDDAHSLRRWLDHARDALHPSTAGSA